MKKKVLNNIFMGKAAGKTFSSFPKYFYTMLILIGILLLLPIKVLMARDFRDNGYLKSWRIKRGQDFSIIYTHSVQLTDVLESYEIEGRHIILRETYFKSYGAGLPATTPYDFEITDQGFRIYNIDETMTNLIYRTGAERANHRIKINEKEYKFLDFSGPRTGVKFDIKKKPFISYIVREGFR